MRIGILTAGGDCPGINAAIRGVGKSAILEYGMEVIGIRDGYLGLIEKDYTPLDERALSGILTVGGTILGTSREKPFKNGSNSSSVSKPELIQKNYDELKLDCLVCIGGNGTIKTAEKLSRMGMNIICIPKTIDNDIWGTDASFGFDSAVNIATEALDRLHSTANSHKRIMLMEVMGHHAGWLTLYTGIAGGADVILIPEIGYSMEIINSYLRKRQMNSKPYSIIVVAEGIEFPEENYSSAAHYIAKLVEESTGMETRETVLGYIQRGGIPSPMDRLLATQFGAYAAQLISEKKFGNLVILKGDKISKIPLKDSAGKTKLVSEDHPLIEDARLLRTCFGDR